MSTMDEETNWCIYCHDENFVANNLKSIDFDEQNQYVLITAKDGLHIYDGKRTTDKLKESKLASPTLANARCMYLPETKSLLVSDGERINIRGSVDRVYYVDTIMHERVSNKDQMVELHIPASKLDGFFEVYKKKDPPKIQNTAELVSELQSKYNQAKQKSRGISKWDTIIMTGKQGEMKEVFTSIMNFCKPAIDFSGHNRNREKLPGLPIMGTIADMCNYYDPNFNPYLLPDTSRTSPIREDMYSELVRQLTFKNWPHADFLKASSNNMAAAGFFHMPDVAATDRVLCFCCPVNLISWEPNDDPESEHSTHQFDCPHVSDDYFTHNVPISVYNATRTATRHHHIDICHGVCGKDIYLGSLSPDSHIVNIWKNDKLIVLRNQIQFETKVTAYCLLGQNNEHSKLVLCTAVQDPQHGFKIQLWKAGCSAIEPRSSTPYTVQEPGVEGMDTVEPKKGEMIQTLPSPQQFCTDIVAKNYTVKNIIPLQNTPGILVYLTSEDQIMKPNPAAALFYYEVRVGQGIARLNPKPVAQYFIRSETDFIRNIHELHTKFSKMRRLGNEQNEHLLITTKSGGVKVLLLRTLEELCSLQSKQKFIQTTYCTEKDRVIGITESGLMITLHINPMAYDVMSKFSTPEHEQECKNYLKKDLSLHKLTTLFTLTETEELEGDYILSLPDGWGDSKLPVTAQSDYERKNETNTDTFMYPDTKYFTPQSEKLLTDKEYLIEISLPKLNSLSQVTIRMNMSSDNSHFPPYKLALLRSTRERLPDEKQKATSRSHDAFLTRKYLDENELEYLCEPVTVRDFVVGGGRSAIVTLTATNLLKTQTRKLILCVKKLSTHDHQTNEASMLKDRLHAGQKQESSRYSSDSSVLSFSVTVKRVKTPENMPVPALMRILMIEDVEFLHRVVKSAITGRLAYSSDDLTELEPDEFIKCTSLKLIGWCIYLQMTSRNMKEVFKQVLSEVLRCAHDLVMSNLIRGTRSSASAYLDFFNMIVIVGLEYGFSSEVKHFTLTNLKTLLSAIPHMTEIQSTGAFDYFLVFLNRLKKFDMDSVVTALTTNLHILSDLMSQSFNREDRQSRTNGRGGSSQTYDIELFSATLPDFMLRSPFIPTTAFGAAVASSRHTPTNTSLPPVDMMNIDSHGLSPGEQVSTRYIGLIETQPLQFDFNRHSENVHITKGNDPNASPTYYGMGSNSMPDTYQITHGYPVNVKQVGGTNLRKALAVRDTVFTPEAKAAKLNSTIPSHGGSVSLPYTSINSVLQPCNEFSHLSSRTCGTSRRYTTLDFGLPVRLTDIVIPVVPDCYAVTVDGWNEFDADGQTPRDKRRVLVHQEIGTRVAVISDIQPPLVVRYLKCYWTINQKNPHGSNFRIPQGIYYGHSYVFPWETADPNIPTLRTIEDVFKQIQVYKSIADESQIKFNAVMSKRTKSEQLFGVAGADGDQWRNQHNLAIQQLRRLQNVLPRVLRSSNLHHGVSRDKLRYLIEGTMKFLLVTSAKNGVSSELYELMPAEKTKSLFINMCSTQIRSLQILTGDLILKVCSEQNWFGQLFGKIISEMFRSSSKLELDRTQFFNLLVSMAQRTLDASKGKSSLVCGRILGMLSQHLAPLLSDNSNTGGPTGSVEAEVVSWLLLFMSRILDISFSSNNDPILVDRWRFLVAESNLAANKKVKLSSERQKARQNRDNLASRRATKRPSSSTGEQPEKSRKVGGIKKMINKVTGKKSDGGASSSYSAESENDDEVVLTIQQVQPVVQGLIALILKLNSSCHSDLFMLACKVLSRISTSTRPALNLSQIASKEQLLQIISNITSKTFNNQGAAWGGHWVKHSIICLLEDIIEGECGFADSGSLRPARVDDDDDMSGGGYGGRRSSRNQRGRRYDDDDDPYERDEMYDRMSMMGRPPDRMLRRMMMRGGPRFDRMSDDPMMMMEMRMMMEFEEEMMFGRGMRGPDPMDLMMMRDPMMARGMMRGGADIGADPSWVPPCGAVCVYTSDIRPENGGHYRKVEWVHEDYSKIQRILTSKNQLSSSSSGVISSEGFEDEAVTQSMYTNILAQTNRQSVASGDLLGEIFSNLVQHTDTDQFALISLYMRLVTELKESSNQKRIQSLIPISEQAINAAIYHSLTLDSVPDWCAVLKFVELYVFTADKFEKREVKFIQKLSGDNMLEKMFSTFITSSDQPAGSECINSFENILKKMDNVLTSSNTNSTTFDELLINILNHCLKNVVNCRLDALYALLSFMCKKTSLKCSDEKLLLVYKSAVELASNLSHHESTWMLNRDTVESDIREIRKSGGYEHHGVNNDSLREKFTVKLFHLLLKAIENRTPPPDIGHASLTDQTKLSHKQQTDTQKSSARSKTANRHLHPLEVDSPATLASKMVDASDSITMLMTILGNTQRPPTIREEVLSWKCEDSAVVTECVLQLLVMLYRCSKNYRTLIHQLVTHLTSTHNLKINSSLRTYIHVVLYCQDAISSFIDQGGVQAITNKLIRSFNSCPDLNQSFISDVLNYMSESQQAYQGDTNRMEKTHSRIRIPETDESLINFAPISRLECNNLESSANSLYSLTDQGRSQSRSRDKTPSTQFKYKLTEMYIDLTVKLPSAVLVKEVKLEQSPIMSAAPSHVSVVMSHHGAPVLPVSEPLLTINTYSIRVLLHEPVMATDLMIRMYRPGVQTNLSLTQVYILGYPALTENQKLQHPPKSTSLEWMQLLHDCMSNDTQLTSRVLQALDGNPTDLMNTCISMLLSTCGQSYKSVIEKVLTQLALSSTNSSQFLINRLLGQDYHGLLLGQSSQDTISSTSNIIYNVATYTDSHLSTRIKLVLDWLAGCSTAAVAGNSGSVSRAHMNPSPVHINTIVALLWNSRKSGLYNHIKSFITSTFFNTVYDWSSRISVRNNPRLKRSVDNIITTICHLNTDLFKTLLKRYTDEYKGGLQLNRSLISDQSQLLTLSSVCQSEQCVEILLRSTVLTMISQFIHKICITPERTTNNISVMAGLLDFLADASSTNVNVKQWAATSEGSMFWNPLLKLCNRGGTNIGTDLEWTVMRFFQTVTVNNESSQDTFSHAVSAVLSSQPAGILSTFMRNLILEVLLEHDYVYITLETSPDSYINFLSTDVNDFGFIRDGLPGSHITLHLPVTTTVKELREKVYKSAEGTDLDDTKLHHRSFELKHSLINTGTAIDGNVTVADMMVAIASRGELSVDHITLQIDTSSRPGNVSSVRNKTDYPRLLKPFMKYGGLALLAERLPMLFPRTDAPVPTTSADDMEVDEAPTPIIQSNSSGIPTPTLICLGLFLRLNGYADSLLKHRGADYLLKLILGGNQDIGVDADSITAELTTLPYTVLQSLYASYPVSTDDGLTLRQKTLELGILHVILSSMSVLTQLKSKRDLSENSEHKHLIKTVLQMTAQAMSRKSGSTTRPAAVTHSGFAKGTGYASGDTSTQYDLEQAKLNKREEEEYIAVLLNVLSTFICHNTSASTTGGQLPSSLMGILEDSCLQACVASYLRNESVLDISQHIPIYTSVLNLLNSISCSQQTVTFLTASTLENQMCTVIDLMNRTKGAFLSYLEKDKSSDQTSKDTQALNNLYKQLNNTIAQCSKAVEVYKKSPRSKEMQSQASTINPSEMKPEQRYIQSLKQYQFNETAMCEARGYNIHFHQQYHYESQARQSMGAGSNANRLRRLAQELTSLRTGLPLTSSSSVFVRYDSERTDMMKVLITGPSDTPYENGCFLFDVFFPVEYPNSPPLVNLRTTGGNRVRFNPNLYNDGKVCLSVLNTWHGRPEEKWSPSSSFLQVLVSIQSLILVSEPYFNEPGYERSRGTLEGTLACKDYDSTIRQSCVKYAMVDMIINPPKCFKEVIHRHFYLKRHEIMKTIRLWVQDQELSIDTKELKTNKLYQNIQHNTVQLKSHTHSLIAELKKMTPPPGLEDLAEFTIDPNSIFES